MDAPGWETPRASHRDEREPAADLFPRELGGIFLGEIDGKKIKVA
jgi:hypothetical protein